MSDDDCNCEEIDEDYRNRQCTWAIVGSSNLGEYCDLMKEISDRIEIIYRRKTLNKNTHLIISTKDVTPYLKE